jgi:hypothetical protein
VQQLNKGQETRIQLQNTYLLLTATNYITSLEPWFTLSRRSAAKLAMLLDVVVQMSVIFLQLQ